MIRSAWQATVVSLEGRAIAIRGASGSGKTSLALALIDRGARLVGDDGVETERRGDTVWTMPHPNTWGLIEIRNVGLTTFDPVEAPLALILDLARDAPRHVEQSGTVEILGVAVPRLPLWPDSPILALRAEMALTIHGLPV